MLVRPVQLRRKIVRRPNDSHFLGLIAKADSSASAYIANFEIERILREEQYVGRFDIAMCNFRSLQMREHFDHGGYKHKDILLVEVLLPLPEIGLKVGDSLFHLDVALLEGVDVALLLLQDKAATVLHNVRMRIGLDLGK